MTYATARPLAFILAVTIFSFPFAHGQEHVTVPAAPTVDASHTWDIAEARAPAGSKIFVVPSASPTHRIACSVRSFTTDQLVCKRSFGATRTYKASEISALILRGDGDLKIRILLALNAAVGAAIWGTVVLASTCVPCAVATGVVALVVFCAAGAIAIGDDLPNSLLYLAPGQQLQVKGYVPSGN